MRDLDKIVQEFRKAIKNTPKDELEKIAQRIDKMEGGSVTFNEYLHTFNNQYFYAEDSLSSVSSCMNHLQTMACIVKSKVVTSRKPARLAMTESLIPSAENYKVSKVEFGEGNVFSWLRIPKRPAGFKEQVSNFSSPRAHA